MNMMGNFGGAVGPVVVGFILAAGGMAANAPPSSQSWITALLLTAVIYWIGAAAWLFIDPVTPLEGPVEPRHAVSGTPHSSGA